MSKNGLASISRLPRLAPRTWSSSAGRPRSGSEVVFLVGQGGRPLEARGLRGERGRARGGGGDPAAHRRTALQHANPQGEEKKLAKFQYQSRKLLSSLL